MFRYALMPSAGETSMVSVESSPKLIRSLAFNETIALPLKLWSTLASISLCILVLLIGVPFSNTSSITVS